MGKIIKKRVEYGGSSNSAENIKYDDTKNVKEAINEVKSEIADVNSNLPYLKVSNVADSNGNPLPPSSFRDSALSIGYTHGSFFGLDVTAYIPIITMRWYDSSENIRTIQHALSGITTYTRYSVSPTEWSQWTKGATQSQIDSLTTITRKVVTAELFGDYIQYGSAICIKIGRIVWLHINVTFSNAISSYGEVLGKLPDEFTPIESFTYGLTPTNPSSTASNYFEIVNNGNSICYNSPDTHGVYNFCGAYISKS